MVYRSISQAKKWRGTKCLEVLKTKRSTRALDELKLGFKFNYKTDGNIITITQ